jgi:hypothetical protein
MDIKVVTIKTYAKKECKLAKKDIKLFIILKFNVYKNSYFF